MAHETADIEEELRGPSVLCELGRSRAELFKVNEEWIAKGKPENGPLAEKWHAARARHLDALAVVMKIADTLAEAEGAFSRSSP